MEKKLDKFHTPLLGVLVALLGIGLLNLYSALDVWGETGLAHLFWSQLVWIGIGFFVFLILFWFDYRYWERLHWFAYGVSLFLLVLVLLFGTMRGGNRSWLALGTFSFQPSELAKLSLIIVLSKYFSTHARPEGYTAKQLGVPLLLMMIPFLLVIGQKDLGSALFFPIIFVSMAWAACIQKKTIILGLVLAIVAGVGGYQYALSGYQKERVRTFLDPSHDVRGSGYHLLQSKIAVGSGSFFGRGYLKGKINKLKYLPEKHTDFVFSVLAEEWGFLGSTVLLGLFISLLWMSLQIAIRARERFGGFLAFGIVALLFWQILINLGGVLGIMPLTGVTLPFLSYGGSSIVVTLGAAGLLFNIHMRRFMF